MKIKKQQITVNNAPVSIYSEDQITMALIGPGHLYTEEVLGNLLGDSVHMIKKHYVDSHTKAIMAAIKGKVDLAFAPVENSLDGDVGETLKALIKVHKANQPTKKENTLPTILGEIIQKAEHALIARKGEDIHKIYSHPTVLTHCRTYIEKHYPDVELIPTISTYDAFETIHHMSYAATIADKRLLKKDQEFAIIKENIADDPRNSTRFLIIGRGDTKPSKKDTTTIIFIPDNDYPGLLAHFLSILQMWNINLTKIDSHPNGKMNVYQFLISLEGHIKDDNLQQALKTIEAKYGKSLLLLGSYKKAHVPEGGEEPGSIANGD